MKQFPVSLAVLPALFLALSLTPVASAAHPRHAAASAHAVSSRSSRAHHSVRAEHVAVVHHEPVPPMDPERATAIQAALIHAGYLSGEPTGTWDNDSIVAMQKLQDENGWQTKYTPDSRALVKLGLGAGSTPTVAAVTQPALTVDTNQTIPAAQQ